MNKQTARRRMKNDVSIVLFLIIVVSVFGVTWAPLMVSSFTIKNLASLKETEFLKETLDHIKVCEPFRLLPTKVVFLKISSCKYMYAIF